MSEVSDHVGAPKARFGSRVRAAEPAILLGGGPSARLVLNQLRRDYAFAPVGYLDKADVGLDGVPYAGTTDDLERVLREAAAQRVVVVSPPDRAESVADVARRAGALGIQTLIAPQLADALPTVDGVTVLERQPRRLGRPSEIGKRAFDLALTVTGLVLTLPLMLVIAAAIKVTTRGRVLYVQERVGRRGRRFQLYKFRTMVNDADRLVPDLRRLSRHPGWLLVDDDPRVTPIGRALRLWSLDELPQLWNVIRGDMSLVGPRPMTPEIDSHIFGWARRRLDVRPGVTGLWQVLGRVSIPFDEMLRLDYLYVTNRSLWQDVKILVRTVPAVLGRRGAN